MMDWIDIQSVSKTTESYMAAFNEMVKICPKLQPDTNSFNQRTVLPSQWRPTFGANQEGFLPYVTRIYTDFESLFDFNTPKIIQPSWYVWKDTWFKFNWYIDFPFEIYAWEAERQELINDDEDNPEYKTTPKTLVAWSKERITLSSDYSHYKAWGLKDWKIKYQEILSYMDVCRNKDIVDKYHEAVLKANSEVDRWEDALSKLTSQKIPTVK